MRIWFLGVALTLAPVVLVQPAAAGVAPALGGGQQSLSGAKIAPVKKPEAQEQHGNDRPETRQDERK
jgi:hypothetical protein